MAQVFFVPGSSCAHPDFDTDFMVSVLAVLKSLFVDVEDFDRVVGASTGELCPGALV